MTNKTTAFSFKDLASSIVWAGGIIMVAIGLIMALNVGLKHYVFQIPSQSLTYQIENCSLEPKFEQEKEITKTEEEITKCEERIRKNQTERDNISRAETLINGLVLVLVGSGLWWTQRRRKED